MTNMENIKSLSERELAWFLMAYSDPCRTCVYKKFFTQEGHYGKFLKPYSCEDIPEDAKLSCINATQAWLGRETEENEDDMFMFNTSRNNVKIADRNAEIERCRKEVEKRKEEQEYIDELEGIINV